VQWEKIQSLVKKGIDEGATLVTGGLGRPDGLNKGYYVRPTVFADVSNEMTIAREEIFGPVLSIISYKNEDNAVRIANDAPYGLAANAASIAVGPAIATRDSNRTSVAVADVRSVPQPHIRAGDARATRPRPAERRSR
jgi:acyl-CoA reductase-like NAD-dependent aldehyde dehydrogenase